MIIGLTGSLATGKTTVAKMLKKRGAYVIDADKIVHSILGSCERKRLSRFVFDDKEALGRLCRTIHPAVKREIAQRIRRNKTKKNIVIDAPLLIESRLHNRCQVIIVVKANLATQIRRAALSLRLGRADCLKRIKRQLSLRKKIAMADFVIDNSGSLRDTEKQVEQLWKRLTRDSR